MGRLIDADKLKENLKSLPLMSNWGESFMPMLIDEQPTAFDVEEVCEQFVLKGRPLNPDEHYITVPDAIEIVKGGVK